MKTPMPLLVLGFFTLAGTTAFAGRQSAVEKVITPPQPETWQFKLAVPSWLASVRGDSGINGKTSHSNIGFNELANKLDMVGSIRAEASYGRFGILTDFSYLSLSDSIGVDKAVRKVDFREDQMLGELGMRWRVIDTPRGWMDVIGGTRYTYIYDEINLQRDDNRIGEISTRLAEAGTALRLKLAQELASLGGNDPHFPGPAIATGEGERLARSIERIKGCTEERAKAIEKTLKKALNRRLSRTDQWLDPYIGLRGRYNFSDKCYFTGRADISPFDIGSDFAWQASAGFGCQLTSRIYGELVYRILDVDYRHDGLIYDTTTHGPELTLGMSF